MSKRQKDTALRVAKVPYEEFERDIESDNPPTVTELAERGTNAAEVTVEIRQRVGDHPMA